jgi:hypothetical protein
MERFTQPVATEGNGFGLFCRFSGADHLRLVANGCNHGAPKGSMPGSASSSLRQPQLMARIGRGDMASGRHRLGLEGRRKQWLNDQ